MLAEGSVVDSPADHPNHEALLYEGEGEFLAGTLPFIREGLAAGEVVMVAVPSERIQQLTKALGRDAAAVRFVDMREIGTNPARIIPAWVQFVEDASPEGRPVRGIGEPVWAERSADELAECERHEALLNLVLAKRAQLRLLCPYDVASLDQTALEVGHRTHPVVRHRGRQLSSDLYVGIDGVTAHFEGPLPAPKGQVDEFVFAPGQYLEVRDFFARRAVQAQLPTMRRADLEWAVTELVTNSIQRGGGRGKVRVWADSAGLVCEVQDRGRIENPLVGRERPMLPEEHGRGLWLVNQLCNLAQIRSSDAGTTVRIHVSRAQGNREVGELPLLADQLVAALDRFSSDVDRRLSQPDRSLLWKLSPGSDAVLLSLPDQGATPEGFDRSATQTKGPAGAVRAELEAAEMVERTLGPAGGERWVPTPRARKLRDAVAAARRAALEEMLSRVPPTHLAVVGSALVQWAAR